MTCVCASWRPEKSLAMREMPCRASTSVEQRWLVIRHGLVCSLGNPGEGRGGNREEREKGMRQDNRPALSSTVCLPLLPLLDAQHRGIWPASSVQLHQITVQHRTARNNSNHITRTSCTLCSRPSRTSPILSPPATSLARTANRHAMAQVQASIMYSDTLCMSIAYIAAKYSIPVLSFEARAASHRGSTLYCTLHVYITWLVQIQRLGPLWRPG